MAQVAAPASFSTKRTAKLLITCGQKVAQHCPPSWTREIISFGSTAMATYGMTLVTSAWGFTWYLPPPPSPPSPSSPSAFFPYALLFLCIMFMIPVLPVNYAHSGQRVAKRDQQQLYESDAFRRRLRTILVSMKLFFCFGRAIEHPSIRVSF